MCDLDYVSLRGDGQMEFLLVKEGHAALVSLNYLRRALAEVNTEARSLDDVYRELYLLPRVTGSPLRVDAVLSDTETGPVVSLKTIPLGMEVYVQELSQ